MTAVSCWIESGISLKMEQDAEEERGLYYWIKPKVLENQMLVLEHVMPSFIICMSGLGVSTLIFLAEIIIPKYQKTE